MAASSKDSDNQVEITFPTPDDAVAMGIRDWPQKFHSKPWSESVSGGQTLTRYVLDGRGRVTIDYMDSYSGNVKRRKERVYPGTLVEVDGEAVLFWELDNEKEGMIILTPNFEEGGKFLLIAGLLLVFCAGLLAGSGGL